MQRNQQRLTVLPKPDGPMSSVMPSSSTESANVVVKKTMLMASHVTAEGYEIDHKQPHQDPCANSKPSTNGT